MIQPYYQDELVTLYHGDCRDVLPRLSELDVLVTDPPYGIGYRSGRGNHEGITGDDGSLPLGAWLPAALRALRRGRHVYVFGCRDSDLSPEWPICGTAELVWDKGVIGMGDLSAPWGPQHEPILFGVQEISKANRNKNYGALAARLRKGSVLRVQRRQSGQTLRHPTEKPVELCRILIETSSSFGDIVLDPFAGSGAVLEAAVLEGRKAVGIEVNEQYCRVAADRLRSLLTLFSDAALLAREQR
jgi:DNA modification methylase